jgi:threonine synthase
MRYVSTRGKAPVLSFNDVLLAGLATDGGLYLPQSWPEFSAADFRALRGLSYADLAARVMAPFVGDAIPPATLETLCRAAWADFSHPAVCPMRQADGRTWLLDLTRGPTLAFKDMAMCLLARLFDHELERQDGHVTVIGATSGDTGAAAVAAFAGRSRAHIVMLHPKGWVSEVQRRQMTTIDAPNVTNVAVRGTFDDCQDLVKAMFADQALRAEMQLSAVNSINWARVLAQVPYYVAAALALGAPDRPVAFAVPTGNFGNVLAGWVAARIGLPVARLVIGSNSNDILTRFLAANDMTMASVTPTYSPSMDIQVSSNFERLLFMLLDRDAAATAATVQEFRATGRMPVPDAAWRAATRDFAGHAQDDAATLAEMAAYHRATGDLIDPHTAIGLAAARAQAPADPAIPVIALETAHPAKFPEAVQRATGIHPALPPHLSDLMARRERVVEVDNDLAAVTALVRASSPRIGTKEIA